MNFRKTFSQSLTKTLFRHRRPCSELFGDGRPNNFGAPRQIEGSSFCFDVPKTSDAVLQRAGNWTSSKTEAGKERRCPSFRRFAYMSSPSGENQTAGPKTGSFEIT